LEIQSNGGLTIGVDAVCVDWESATMKVGDLVRHTGDGSVGMVIGYEPNQETLVDSMFPYHVHFIDEVVSDWFGSTCMEVISESR